MPSHPCAAGLVHIQGFVNSVHLWDLEHQMVLQKFYHYVSFLCDEQNSLFVQIAVHTQCTDTVLVHCVSDNVLSSLVLSRMIYYTRHTYEVSLQCVVVVCVPLEFLFD